MFYLKNVRGINNWDLVDLSAPKIVGKHLLNKDRSLLYKFALSKNLWERRIAILSTYEFIRNNEFKTALGAGEHATVGAEAQQAQITLDWLNGKWQQV